MKKLVSFFFVFLIFSISSALAQQPSFIKVANNKFELNSKPLQFIGTNMWYANILAMPTNKGGNRKRLIKELDFLKQNGITNIRVLIGAQSNGKKINAVTPVHPALQTNVGIYNLDLLDGMDFLLNEMNKRNLNAVFFFGNNWEWSGGFLQYLNWHNRLDDTTMAKKFTWDENQDIVSKFYTCTDCQKDFWSFISMILKHTNKITGKKYIDEPSILAWEIANEPRPMRPTAIPAYKIFLSKTAALIKQSDKNHLLTLGTEGYMGTETMEVFKQIHQDKNIDYATIHIWPKNWGWYKDSTFKNDFETVLTKTSKYINDHNAVMTTIGKPLVVEEFGMPRDNFSFSTSSTIDYRNKYFENILKTLIANKNIGGLNFWTFGGFGKAAANETPFWKEGDDLLGDPPMEEQGLNSVFATDASTWKLIKKYAAQLKK